MKSQNLRFLTIFLFTFITLLSNNNSFELHSSAAKMNKFNAMSVLNPDTCATINAKFLFVYKSKTNKNPNYPLNKLDYKFIQLTKTDLIVYRAKSQDPSSNYNQDTTNYLMTFKLKNIDLPCNDFLYICTVEEFRNEYARKLRGIDFKVNPLVQGRLGRDVSDKHCLLITQGSFDSLDELPYLCFDTFEQLVQIQNVLSERIIEATLNRYDGVLEMLNEEQNNLVPVVFDLKRNFLVVSNGLSPDNDSYKEYLKVKYPRFNGYSLVLMNRDLMNWEGQKNAKPDDSRCFKIEVKPEEELFKHFFCVYYDRNDIRRKYLLNNIKSDYVNDIWVSRINMKLHVIKLKLSQEKVIRAIGPLDCNSHILEPIKYEIRMRYLVMRHKIHQLVMLRKFNFVEGLKKIENYKKKIIEAACSSSKICIQAVSLCLSKGYLPLKLKGYQVAMSLQNPYLVLDPKLGVAVREYPKKSVGLQLVKTAEKLLGVNSQSSNSINKIDIVMDSPLVDNLPEVPRPMEIERAMNTYMKVYGGKVISKIEDSGKFCKNYATGSLKNLKRKVDILAITGVNEPFFEYLGFIRDKQFITK